MTTGSAGPAPRSGSGLVRRAFAEVRGHRGSLLAVLGLDLIHVPMALLQPIPLRLLADNVIGGRAWPAWATGLLPSIGDPVIGLWTVVVGSLVVAVVSRLQTYGSWVLSDRVALTITDGFRARLFDHLQSLPLRFHDRRDTGDTIHRVTADGDAVRGLTLGLVPYLISGATAIGMAVVLLRLDPLMAALALVPAPIAFGLMAAAGRRVRVGWDAVLRMESAAVSVVQETFSAIRVVQAFGREDRESERFRAHDAARRESQVAVTRLEALLDAAVGIIFAAGTAALLWVGVGRIRADALTLGELLVFLAYAAQIHDPLGRLSRAFGEVQQHMASAARAFAVLDVDLEPRERPRARSVHRSAGAVAFEGVGFSYDIATDRAVVRGVDFRVEPGQYVGIYGPSGSGKSTLLLLAARFHDPTEGIVRLDGIDLRALRLADVRRQYSMVLQESVLLSASVADNIAYARPGARADEVVAAAEAAGARDFIEDLPKGFDTLVGERGVLLSGGQRQRIAIARAFLRDAPILLLDEPTSSLDRAASDTVLEAIDRLRVGRTTLHVTHRTEQLGGCDVLLEVGTERRSWGTDGSGASRRSR